MGNLLSPEHYPALGIVLWLACLFLAFGPWPEVVKWLKRQALHAWRGYDAF